MRELREINEVWEDGNLRGAEVDEDDEASSNSDVLQARDEQNLTDHEEEMRRSEGITPVPEVESAEAGVKRCRRGSGRI